MAPNPHTERKMDHLRICAEHDVGSTGLSSGLDQYCLVHRALPELNLDEVDLRVEFLGRPLRAPFLISAITGGAPRARQINRNLAQAAQELGLAMSVGSQRAAIEDSCLEDTYQVRDVAPDVLLFANLGAVQLNYGYGLQECYRAVEMIEANALVLHLNPLQEALQPNGNTRFAHLLDKIAALCRQLEVPIIVKEVGWGISDAVVCQLAEAGVAAVDVAGAGGTSWSEVEKHRARTDLQQRVAEHFAGWGIRTAEAIIRARRCAPDLPIIGSGGIRTGPQAAVALALGSDLVGIAGPLVVPATLSSQAVSDELSVLIEGLRVSMFAAGLRDIASLRTAPLWKPGPQHADQPRSVCHDP
jgi:isopentenyl-diphosphate delta-isomerase